MKIVMTGHDGYLGSVMGPWLMDRGHEVVGLDTGYFHSCTLVPSQREVPARWKDLRDVEPGDLRGFDAVVHLAALSNDPLGDLDPRLTDEINCEATVRVALAAREAGVRRFLFSSSCIMYGMSALATVTEESPLAPRTPYAVSKADSERALSELATREFSPVALRNGTVYGISPRMRFDTVLNNLVACAAATGRVVVNGDGAPWRPVMHIEDVAAAFQAALEAPIEAVHNQAFNVGDDRVNHQIRTLAETVARVVPGCEVEYRKAPEADQRTYKTDFSKIRRMLPSFRVRHAIEAGVLALYEAYRASGLTQAGFTGNRFVRLRWLRHLLSSGQVDGRLRWTAAATEAPGAATMVRV